VRPINTVFFIRFSFFFLHFLYLFSSFHLLQVINVWINTNVYWWLLCKPRDIGAWVQITKLMYLKTVAFISWSQKEYIVFSWMPLVGLRIYSENVPSKGLKYFYMTTKVWQFESTRQLDRHIWHNSNELCRSEWTVLVEFREWIWPTGPPWSSSLAP
jgi:hypothetical protein